MKQKVLAMIASGAFALVAPACSQEAPKTASDQMEPMTSAAPAAASGPIRSVGTVTAIDAAAGSITLDHEPIEAIRWPSMTMKFKAERPDMLKDVAVGDRVAFELKSAAEPQTVTMVEKQ